MPTSSQSRSAAIRARLKHPIIDSDGHTFEFHPLVLDYLRKIGGAKMIERYRHANFWPWDDLSAEERRQLRVARPPWWGMPCKNTLDRATLSLPKLLYERLAEFGLDFSVIYPTLGIPALRIDDPELRPAVCRAFNMMHAELFAEFSDRIAPAAVIPMHTPEEAVAEMEFAVRTLGFKVVMMASHVQRPVAAAGEVGDPRYPSRWVDAFGMDSDYNYDPVWAKCLELKIAPTFHSPAMYWDSRSSISSYTYNHVGTFADGAEIVCKALFLGGVPRRFPKVRFGFLEGGVAWACSLYADIIGHWSKRNREAIHNYNPARLDREKLIELARRYGGRWLDGRVEDLVKGDQRTVDPALLDEFAACGVEKAEEVRDVFTRNFFFGCESDDPLIAWAFNSRVNPCGARLNAMFSSDIGHWDVPDMTEITEEAYELVERGVISEEDFRDFAFVNPARLWTGMNPDFFKGTAVEGDVKKISSATSGGEARAANP
jgi:predicted TIM-barrel fold metal-dependent hydrolase